MQTSRRSFFKLTGALIAAAAVPPALSWMPVQAQAETDPDQLSDDVLHLLNRLTWGPRPEEVERVRTMGIEAYMDEQLNPESIDDSEADVRLAIVPILAMNRAEAHRLADREWRTYLALTRGMITRAVYSKRQLHERVVEFWLDHFNIPSDELGPDLVVYHCEVVRRHSLGNFHDLLMGTAQSPAMLYFLDNYDNVAEHPNENYARELMELHTLGVGNYTEDDVKNVARAFTGWTVWDATESGFYFDPDNHDTDEKVILGHIFPANRGIEDGLHVLSLLASHEANARFICRKLCLRFVSDNPPPELVERLAALWLSERGEIKPVLRALFLSDEFRASANQKLRRPLDFYIAAMRATGTEVDETWIQQEQLETLAQTPYGWKPPNGYPDVAGAWMNTGGLLARWNVAMALTHSALSEPDSGMTSHLMERTGQPATAGELVDAVARQVFATSLSDDQRATYVAYMTEDGDESTDVTPHLLAQKLGTLYGLMLASPQFQWR